MEEILKAKEEGRLIILPCKVGDTIYGFGNKYGFTCIAPLCVNGGQLCFLGGKPCNSVKFIVKEHKFEMGMYDDLGKTLFTTKEEALRNMPEQLQKMFI